MRIMAMGNTLLIIFEKTLNTALLKIVHAIELHQMNAAADL